jgi:hypothetical protein
MTRAKMVLPKVKSNGATMTTGSKAEAMQHEQVRFLCRYLPMIGSQEPLNTSVRLDVLRRV